MIFWGVSALGHDAAITVVDQDCNLLFAAQAERYSRIKNDPHLTDDLVAEALLYGCPKRIVWYEHPLKKRMRQLYSGQLREAFSPLNSPSRYLKKWEAISAVPLSLCGHHRSHAAAGFFTSGFKRATIVVADAIGEWDTLSIWSGEDSKLRLLKRWTYPNSLGLLYSAFTQRVGLKPNEEEYILMGMAAYGKAVHTQSIRDYFFEPKETLRFKINPHIGIADFLPEARLEDLAASIQAIVEEKLTEVLAQAYRLCPNSNAVLMGGLALNCVANSLLARNGPFEQIWIMPNPGDAGSSLGAVAAALSKQLNWRSPYLGTNIPGDYPVKALLNHLLTEGIAGVANGRAEFGPRALGNRSLLADPRRGDIKDRVNEIKRRQKFRPFAPVILENHSRDWFDLPYARSPYMQFVGKCNRPDLVPSIVHWDGTSRVQTVDAGDHPGLHHLLTEWQNATGCPLLLNTSLNIRGQPLVNNEQHALEFEKQYGVRVFISE